MMKWRPTESSENYFWITGVEVLLLPMVLITPLLFVTVIFAPVGLVFLASAVFPFFPIMRAHLGQSPLRTGLVAALVGMSAAKAVLAFVLTFTFFWSGLEVASFLVLDVRPHGFILGIWFAVLAFFSYGLLRQMRTWNMAPTPSTAPLTSFDRSA